MKKLIFIMLLLMLGVMTYAQEPENYVVIEEPTNVRSAPLTGSHQPKPIVRAVIENVNLTIVGRNFDDSSLCARGYYRNSRLWFQVEVDGVKGWVRACDHEFVGDLSTIPQTEPLNAEYRLCSDNSSNLDELGDEPNQSNIIANTLAHRINLRENPDIASQRLDHLTSDTVYVVGRTDDNTWLKVTYKGVVPVCGWAMLGVEHVQLDGWVAGYLLSKPEGWQDIIPVVES